MAPLPSTLVVTFATYWHSSPFLTSPKSLMATPSFSSAPEYTANRSSCESAKTSVSLRNPAWWIEASLLKVWMITSSSSAMRVSQRLTRPSVEPERRMFGSRG